ncbi:membrane protein insertase YidC [Curvivirga aplysinae]|uniref:membrane protein insertase YidC n=1 Tax=Curvivirga aplysinae TaxID=2529852 RepID=UPI0012BC9381|nr:membrane protein insertase YidC [Curvivirga aplysinae]MTI11352.1 membrane protein insertase YidC [Curvivirga aplysinae]
MENKNLILAVVLSLAILLGWNFLYEQPRLQEAADAANAEVVNTDGAPVPANPTANAEMPTPAGEEIQFNIDRPRSAILKDVPRLAIKTDRLEGSLSLKGARIDDLILTDYRETLDPDSAKIQLFQPTGSHNAYYAEFGWWVEKGMAGPNKDTIWSADADVLTVDEPVTLSWNNGQGLTFQQVITLDKDYLFTVTQKVVNDSSQNVSVASYGIISRNKTPETTDFYILHEGMSGVFNETLEELSYGDIQDDKQIQETTTGGWLGITDKYWMSALVPDQSLEVATRFKATPANNDYRYQADFLNPQTVVGAGQTVEATSRLFAGAKQTTLFDQYSAEFGILNFDLAIDFGWFYFLTKPIFYAIHWLYGILGNFGVAILVLTLGIKLLLFPLANKSYQSMSKMKLLQPKIQQIRERAGDDRQKMQQEMMGLYKKEKVNPMAGCLPILVQIPIFFALYKVLFITIEMRHAPFFGWIHDLSAPDPLTILTGFGLFDWQVPAALAMINIGIWPIIMGVTMYLQQKLNPAPADPVQAKIFMFMPIFFTFLLGTFPAGLVIYWAWNNSLSILQQWVIMKRMGVAIGGGKAES